MRLAILAVAVVGGAAVGLAAAVPARAADNGFFSLQVENDKFTGTDRHYTNGLRAAWLSPEKAVPDWARAMARETPVFPDAALARWGLSVGHSIFTPADTATRRPQPDDRPYAGWLYAGLGFTAETGGQLDQMEIQLGVVGPWAMGERVQNDWHRLIGVDKAHGWAHQIHSEPGIMVSYQRQWRAWEKGTLAGLSFDLTPHVGATAGNVMTYGAVGGMARFGRNVPQNDYGPPKIRPNLPGTGQFEPVAGLGWYLFAGVEGRAVLRNIFLDGNSFRDSPGVDKLPLVADLQAGVAVQMGDWRLAYTHVLRTREFRGQKDADRFGSLSLTTRF